MNRLKLASLIALTMSVSAWNAAFAGEVTWWTPNWGEARARELAEKFMAGLTAGATKG